MAKIEKIMCDGCGEESPSYIEAFAVLDGRRLGLGDSWQFCSSECLCIVINKNDSFSTKEKARAFRDNRASKFIDIENYERISASEIEALVAEHIRSQL